MGRAYTTFVVGGLILASWFNLPDAAWAKKLDCPEQPKQVAKDIKTETEAKAATLGKLGSAELKNKTEVIAKDLFEKLPNADRFFLAQMLISTTCQLIDQSTGLSDKEKMDRFNTLTDKITSLITPPAPPTPSNKGNKQGGGPSPEKEIRLSGEHKEQLRNALSSFLLYGADLYRCLNIRESKGLPSPTEAVDKWEGHLLPFVEKVMGKDFYVEIAVAGGSKASGPIVGSQYEKDQYRIDAYAKILQKWTDGLRKNDWSSEIKFTPEARKLLNLGTSSGLC